MASASDAEDKSGAAARPAVYFVLILFASFALFFNLGGRMIWNDEAVTALLAESITKNGLPKVSDGRALIFYASPELSSNDKQVWTWTPWLGEYLTAASFAVLGKSTASARLPFAVIGFLGAILFTRIVFRMYGCHETAIIAGLCLITSTLFILHVRQCRYYSVVIFAEIWLILGLYHLFAGRTGGALHVAAALAAAFYCNYIIVIGNILAIVIAAIIIGKGLWRNIAAAIAAFTAMALPWIIYAKPWVQKGFIEKKSYLHNLYFYVIESNFHLFPYILLLIPAAYYAYGGIKRRAACEVLPRNPDVELFLWIVLPLQLCVFALAPGQFLRYIAPLVPAAAILQAVLLKRYVKAAFVRCVIVGLICITNLPSVYGLSLIKTVPQYYGHKPELPIVNAVHSIALPYEGAMEDIVSFLKKEASPNQSIMVFNYEFPIVFYTDMQVIFGRFDTGQSMPNWIFPRCISCVTDKEPVKIPESVLKCYNPVEIEVHNSKIAGMIPEPDRYEFFSPKEKEILTVYKRKPEAACESVNAL
ncbi:MAG: glycosyltransferase family 39 protein [Candidatus Magnetominusculus sp. LBB02]|nr:glycosyltransferase family 39 protein [Candidatus Magnetominusculus sp. LBB02]